MCFSPFPLSELSWTKYQGTSVLHGADFIVCSLEEDEAEFLLVHFKQWVSGKLIMLIVLVAIFNPKQLPKSMKTLIFFLLNQSPFFLCVSYIKYYNTKLPSAVAILNIVKDDLGSQLGLNWTWLIEAVEFLRPFNWQKRLSISYKAQRGWSIAGK